MHPVSDYCFDFHRTVGAVIVFSVRRSYNAICLKQLNIGQPLLVYFRDSVFSLFVLFEIVQK